MANYCEICGKGTMSGMNVSHSHLKTKRTWKPNIQRVRAIVDGEAKRVKRDDSVTSHLFLCALNEPKKNRPALNYTKTAVLK